MNAFRALLIDDEEELVSTLVERLGYRGIDADYALDGHSALDKMKQTHYDVVVLDVKLPGMDGIEVLHHINSEYSHVPVLLITGHGSPVEGVDRKPEGAFDYLVKPINIEDLIAKMQEAVGIK